MGQIRNLSQSDNQQTCCFASLLIHDTNDFFVFHVALAFEKWFFFGCEIYKDIFIAFLDANSKARIGLARYEMLQQRTARHKLFSTNNAISTTSNESSAAIDDKKYALKTVDFLLGTNTRIENVIVLGMLTMLKQGIYSLEDPTGSLDLDLTEAKFHKGLYTENCFVLVEGWYEDRIFHVVAMGHPPIEGSEVRLLGLKLGPL